jgi:hypothetical protein
VLKIKEKSKCSFSGGNAHIRRRTNFPAHVRAQVGKAYFNGTKVGQMPSGVYDFKVGDILLIKTFSVPPEPKRSCDGGQHLQCQPPRGLLLGQGRII